ncbi:MAG: leucine-rich repeat protein [Lachnospiraceae bacterium]|nr:leucine-rich repeat protein [Lachnospiraceae bacterium]
MTSMTGEQDLYFYALDIGGGNNAYLGYRTVNIKQGKSPIGSLDTVASKHPGTFWAGGWALDEDDSAPIDIHVYIGGEAGDPNAQGYAISADQERTDVGEIYPDMGKMHGFCQEFSTTKTGEQEVYVYAIDAASNQPDVLLGHKTVVIEKSVEEEHIHTYEKTIKKQATCTEQGECLYTCACGDSYCGVIEKLPHTEVEDSAQAATCVKDGLTQGSHCSVCGIILTTQETIEKTGHKNVVIKYKKDASCMYVGYTGDSYCVDCGVCIKEGEIIRPLEHTIGEEVVNLKEATEAEAGVKVFVCTECGTTALKIIPAIGAEQLKDSQDHSHTYVEEVLKAPTYNSPGTMLYVCRCSDYYETVIPMVEDPESESTETKSSETDTENSSQKEETVVSSQSESTEENETGTEQPGTEKPETEQPGTENNDSEGMESEMPDYEDVDRSLLEETITNALELRVDEYTPESYTEFKTALNQAIAVYGDTDATQIEINQAYFLLKEAIAGLQKKSTETGGVKKGDKITYKGNSYTVLSVGKKTTVQFSKASSTAKTIAVPAVIPYQGTSYKVTEISANACKNRKNITKVVIGDHVTSIGAQAFLGCVNLKNITVGTNVKTIGKEAFKKCGKLKTITIQSTKLNKVGANALKGIHKNAVIKVPKKKLTYYKKLLSGKGQGKKVIIKK